MEEKNSAGSALSKTELQSRRDRYSQLFPNVSSSSILTVCKCIEIERESFLE